MNQNQSAMSVTDLNRYIKALVGQDDVLSAVTVRGEISNLKLHSSGHWYFTLKDAGAEISAVMFKGDAMRVSFRPTDGMRVVVYGSVDVYEKTGRVQVYARALRADGDGALAAALERLKKQLTAEGLFAPERKRKIPRFPRCVGVITAPTGAAVRDILNITGRRFPQAKILLYPSLVQGPDAPAMLCAGLSYLNADQSCDVIILGRGGGSIEDLWAFNDEALVRAVAASQIPVISAVGHETDFTLCDFAADMRAPTPSAAAELAVPDRAALSEWLTQAEDRLERRMAEGIERRKNAVLRYSQALALRSPEARLTDLRRRTDHHAELMDRLMRMRLDRQTARLQAAAQQLDALNPLAVLGRGYSALRDGSGRILTSARQLTAGQEVDIILADGQARAEIRAVEQK